MILRIGILAAGNAFSGQRPGGYPPRVIEFAQHHHGGIRHRSGIVTADSGIVTGHSGQESKSVTFRPESPVT
ncbi:hypothetical protein, partial [Ramlibacter sp.]|uniref:hypothetical protein n=1 Tax=Ramlibacter sp. TaxID=1917967 RepID=UPI00261AE473